MDKNCMNCTRRIVNLYADGREVNICGLVPDMKVNARMHCEKWSNRVTIDIGREKPIPRHVQELIKM